MIHFTPSVGVAPSTTTVQLNGSLCMLGECAPGYFGPAVMLPGSAPPPMPLGAQHLVAFNPYANEAKLTGLRGLGATSPAGMFALALGLGFASVLGYSFWKKRNRQPAKIAGLGFFFSKFCPGDIVNLHPGAPGYKEGARTATILRSNSDNGFQIKLDNGQEVRSYGKADFLKKIGRSKDPDLQRLCGAKFPTHKRRSKH